MGLRADCRQTLRRSSNDGTLVGRTRLTSHSVILSTRGMVFRCASAIDTFMLNPHASDAPLTNESLRQIIATALQGAADALRPKLASQLYESHLGPPPPQLDQEPTGRLTLSVTEASESLGVSRSLMYELVASGQVPSIKLGKRRLVPVSALQKWISSEANTQ